MHSVKILPYSDNVTFICALLYIDTCALVFSDVVTCRYQIKNTKEQRSIVFELLLALVASFFLGVGTLFLMLWIGFTV